MKSEVVKLHGRNEGEIRDCAMGLQQWEAPAVSNCRTTIIAMRIQRFFSTVQFVDKSMQ